MAAKKKGLGRGLDALLGPVDTAPAPAATGRPASTATVQAVPSTPAPVGERLASLSLDLLQRGEYQPRQDMHKETLEDLAASIKSQGVVQPIVVRALINASGGEQRYEIIAGERRWRAAQIAGLSEIPVVIRDIPDSAAIAMALIENIQRENLN
ncbi:MAG: ParB/RepB/Spo0J family partition protein, partial [Gammaproteobacteria bacterium]